MWVAVGGDTALKAVNGYTHLPSGVIIQWGSQNGVCTGFTVNLNITYPTSIISASASPISTGSFYESTIYAYTNTSFNVANAGCFGGTYTYRWMSIGY